MDAEFGKKWLEILEIRDKKTYVPPNLDIFFDKERLVYFFIGLVDGDGCIWLRKKRWIHLKIEIHVNWLPVLQKLSIALKELYGIESKVSVSKKNTAVMQINGVENFRLLQSFLIGIDFMERKWDQIQSTIEI
jgi:intein/homing endonuclease